MARKTLLISTYNADLRPWNGVSYEFLNVVAGLEDATVIAPPSSDAAVSQNSSLNSAALKAYDRLTNLVRQVPRLYRGSVMQPASVKEPHDLCFFMCQFPKDLPSVEQVSGWRAHSQRAAVFLMESWSSELPRQSKLLRVLDKFDHVFVLNSQAIPELRKHTKTPVSFLPPAADSLAAWPGPAKGRVVDVLSLGRRIPETHKKLLEIARRQDLFYVFDMWGGIRALNWAEIRAANADMIRRSKYYVVWSPGAAKARTQPQLSADSPLTTRYFEGAAGGAILLGTRPRSAEFETLFDWPDAVVDLSPAGEDVEARLAELEADPARCARIRARNVVNSLRRHDWSHRWDVVLQTFGFERTARHEARLREAEARARQAEIETFGHRGRPVGAAGAV
jgi:hypothetical protein